MKILVAGGTGAIGRELVPMLVAAGHEVAVLARTTASAVLARTYEAVPFTVDALDRNAVFECVDRFRPEVVVNQLSALPREPDLRQLGRDLARTNELRTRATDTLVEAGERAGARQIVAQSFAGWPYEPGGRRVKVEEDPLDAHPPRKLRPALEAIRHLEHVVTSARSMRGVVLRYGSLYGPGTAVAPGGAVVRAVRARTVPILGDGGATWSFVHVRDAAAATVLAIEHRAQGIFNVVDDEPARVSEWLPFLASHLDAKPPRRVPLWVARLVVGNAGLMMMTEACGASNQKAKSVLGWEPWLPSWRAGFAAVAREARRPITGSDRWAEYMNSGRMPA